MPRFVLLAHDHPAPHFDLLLEAGPVLWSWRLGEEMPAGRWLEAERAPDHRPLYLDYEGEVSGGRGRVDQRMAGTFDWRSGGTEGELALDLEAGAVRGRLVLRHEEGTRWRALFTPTE